MRSTYNKQAIQEVAQDILAKGLRVFIAESGTYGIYTNQEGTRVVYFQADLDGVNFSGCYSSPIRSGCGTGWRIGNWLDHKDYAAMLQYAPPRWATGGNRVTMLDLDRYLAKSAHSRYKEVYQKRAQQPLPAFNDCK